MQLMNQKLLILCKAKTISILNISSYTNKPQSFIEAALEYLLCDNI